MTDLKSTPQDRAILGPSWRNMPAHDDWDGNGWKDGLPADDTDYTKLHRDGALRGDFVRATYYATLLLLRVQEAATREAHTANLIAYADTLPASSGLRYVLRERIEKELNHG